MLIRRLVLPLVLLAGLVSPIAARAATAPIALDGPRVVELGSDVDAGTRVDAAPAGKGGTAAAAPAAATATFSVTYTGFTPAAQAAFQAAVDVWAGLVTSSVPITVDAKFQSMPGGQLGLAGPRLLLGFPGAPRTDTFYPVPIANALTGTDQEPALPDITATFSSAVSNWYFGTDGSTPSGQFDFETVVLHELGHGLGLVESFDVAGGQGSWGQLSPARPFVYDRFVVDQGGTPLIDTSVYPNPSSALGVALQSNAVYFDGPKARAANGGNRVKLQAAATWSDTASISHLDEATYPPGDPNSLMTPVTQTRESIHVPGPISLCMLQDLGLPTAQTCSGAPAAPDFTPLTPARIVDTRDGTGGVTGPLGPTATINPKVTGVGGVPATGVGAVVLNVTVTAGTASSFLTVYPSGQPRPNASNLNFTAGQDVPNLVVAKVGPDGRVVAYNSQGNVQVIFDVVGWFT
jgi:hypothetical protein